MLNGVEPTLLHRPIEEVSEQARRRALGGGGRQAAAEAARARLGVHGLTGNDAPTVAPAELARRVREQAAREEALRRAGAEAQLRATGRRTTRRSRAVGYRPTARDGVHPDIPNETEN